MLDGMSSAPRIVPFGSDDDAGPVAAAMNAGFSETEQLQETTDSILERFRFGLADRDVSFVAWDGERVVGLLFGTFRSDGRAWAHGLTLIPDFRGRGLGRDLAQRFIEASEARDVASIHCEVLGNNEVALNLYRSIGFVIVRKLSNFVTEIPVTAPTPGGDIVLCDAEVLPPPDERPARPLHRDRVAIARVPGVRVALHRPTGAHVAWTDGRILDVGGPVDDVAVLRRMLGCLPAGSYKLMGVPQEDPLHDALRGLGMRILARQVEVMRASPRAGRRTS